MPHDEKMPDHFLLPSEKLVRDINATGKEFMEVSSSSIVVDMDKDAWVNLDARTYCRPADPDDKDRVVISRDREGFTIHLTVYRGSHWARKPMPKDDDVTIDYARARVSLPERQILRFKPKLA